MYAISFIVLAIVEAASKTFCLLHKKEKKRFKNAEL